VIRGLYPSSLRFGVRNSFDAKQKPTCQFVFGGGRKTLEAKIESLDA